MKNYRYPYLHAHGEDVQAFQAVRLRRYLSEVVYPFSAYYREVFDKHGVKPQQIRSLEDLQAIPFTSKYDLAPSQDHPQRARDFIVVPDAKKLARRPSVIMKTLLRGRRHVKASFEHEYRPVFMTSTTGRSAEPTPFFYSAHDVEMLGVAGARLIDLGAPDADARVLNMFPYAPHLAYWLVHYACMRKNIFCLSSGGGKTMGTDGNLQLLKKIKPSILVGMPTFVYHVLHQAQEEGVRVESLKRIVLGGEKVPAGTRRKLAGMAEALGSPGVRVMATYGFTEAKLAMGEHPVLAGEPSSGYVTHPDMGIIEIVDPETGKPQPEGVGGEIVYTPLCARGTVVLRYRTGDCVDGGLVYDPCPYTGLRVPRLLGHISRVSNVRPMQLRKLKGTLVDFNQLEHVLDDMSGIGTWQLELRKVNDEPLELDELVLHVTETEEVARDALEQKIRERFVRAIEVSPNRIEYHSSEAMRHRQKVGVAMKEERIVDNRIQVEDQAVKSQTGVKS